MGNRFLPVVCFVLGLILGAGLVWLFHRPEQVLLTAGSDGEGALRNREVEWSRSGSSPSPDPRDAPGTPPRSSSDTDGRRPPLEADEARPRPVGGLHVAWFEVSVLDVDGEPVEAQVYALGAGSKGRGGYELPQVDHDPPGPCLLGVPAAGAWDLGAKTRTWLHLEKDLVAVAGDVVRVEIKVPACKPVRVVTEGPWPKVGEFQNDEYTNHLRMLPVNRDTEWFPGRDQAPSIQADIDDVSSGGPWITAPLQTGVPLRARFATTKKLSDRRWSTSPPPLRIVVEPEEFLAGDTIRLNLAPAAYLRVVLRREKSRAWREGPRTLNLHLDQDGRTQTRRYHMGGPYAFPKPERPARFIGAPGPVTLRWEGEGWMPGRREGIPIEQGRQTDVDLLMRLDPRAMPNPEKLKVVLSGLPAGEEAVRELNFAALIVTGERTGSLGAYFAPDEEVILSPDWRRTTWIIARRGSFVTRPLAPPATGSLKADVQPGGRVVVVPDFPVETEDWGGVEIVLRRQDGLPFYLSVAGDSPEVVLESVTTTGSVIGPLPEGTYTFEASLGGVRLPDATATVAAGKTGVLMITRE